MYSENLAASIHDIDGKPTSVRDPREHLIALLSVGGLTLPVSTWNSSISCLWKELWYRVGHRPATKENDMRLRRLQTEGSSNRQGDHTTG